MYNKNNQRYERNADKKLMLKDPSKLRQQSTLCIFNGCFIEKNPWRCCYTHQNTSYDDVNNFTSLQDFKGTNF